MSSQDASRSSSRGAQTGSHRHSSSVGSSNSSKHSFDEDLRKDDLWSVTTGSPGILSPMKPRAEYDAIEALNDVDEHEHLLNASKNDYGSDSGSSSPSPPEPQEEAPVTWRSLPRKGQLFLLMLARISEPLTQTSLQAYMYYQLKSFNPSLPDATVASQVGIMQGSFTAAQFLTAFLWGKAADSPRIGRKNVIEIGLLGTAISIAGFGFSRNFATAIFFRMLGGVLNGNVGVMRTMIAEIIKEKKFQSRAFMILPMTFNIGVIIGPTLGGMLADPVTTYPGLFGPGSVFGGKDGVWWMRRWPYALPNLISSCFLLAACLLVTLGLDETHYIRKDKKDYGRTVGRWIVHHIFQRRETQAYSAISDQDPDAPHSVEDVELQAASPATNKDPPKRRAKLPFRRIFTRNVILTFIAHGLMGFHVGTFNNLWFIFLSAPRYDPAYPNPPSAKERHLPFGFTGGFALPPPRIGLSLSIIGFIGITLQLILYPRMNARYGIIKCYRVSLALFPIAYFLAPYLSLIPSKTPPPDSASGIAIWIGISMLLFIQVLARTFALPAIIILVNNCCPHPSVLGTIHGLGQSISSGTRTLGPVIAGWLFGRGLNIGVIGLAWWVFAIEAIVGCIAGMFVKEGGGHEIFLEGEEADEEILKANGQA